MENEKIEIQGYFHNSDELERCVFELKNSGIEKKKVSARKVEPHMVIRVGFKNELAIAGSGVGAIVGSVLGFLYSGGFLDFIDIFPSKTISSFSSILAGLIIGALLGGILGWFLKYKIPLIDESESKRSMQKNEIQLSVEVENRAEQELVQYKMAQFGAMDIQKVNP